MKEKTQATNIVDTAGRRPLASSPLIVSLLIILIAAVCVQGIALISLTSNSEDQGTQDRAPGAAADRPLVASKPDQTPGLPPTTAPPSSLLAEDLFSDDWQPFTEMARMRQKMDRLFEDSFQRFRSLPGFDDEWLNPGTASRPAIADEGDHYLVTLDLPGTDESSLEISIENDVLTIGGRRAELSERRDQDGTIIGKSKNTSSFRRSFTLPGQAEIAGLESSYQDGILRIKVPKTGTKA